MELQRIGIKFFADDSTTVQPRDVVPVFHHWIQTHAIEGHLLVDVADYAHVPGGPGALLVAHEANFSLDQSNNRSGLLYHRKKNIDGTFSQRLLAIIHATLTACRLLETDSDLHGKIRFRGDEMLFIANDRLHAPNSEEAYMSVLESLSEVSRKLFETEESEFTRNCDSKERLSVTIRAAQSVPIQTLIDRLRHQS